MHDSATLTLVAAEGCELARNERVAAFGAFERDATAFGFLYCTEDPACASLAACIGDRLWLFPRSQPGLGEPRALLALAWSHPYARVVAVVPAADCDATLDWLREWEPLVRVQRLASVCGRLYELTIESAERDRARCAAGGA